MISAWRGRDMTALAMTDLHKTCAVAITTDLGGSDR